MNHGEKRCENDDDVYPSRPSPEGTEVCTRLILLVPLQRGLKSAIDQGSAFLSVFVNAKGTFGEQEQERVHEHVFLFLFHANL